MWKVEIDVSVSSIDADSFKSLVLAAYAEFRTDGQVTLPTMKAELANGLVTFMGVSTRVSESAACRSVAGAVRCALHVAGASTSGWEQRVDELVGACDDSEPTVERVLQTA